MGLFDPPFKKMILASPAYFQRSAAIWGPLIEATMVAHPLLLRAGNLFRAVVIGRLALTVAQADPDSWVPKSVLYISSTTANAERWLPEPFLGIARNLAIEIIELYNQNSNKDGQIDS